MHKIYTAANLADAYLLRDRLARAGIEVFVFNEHAQGGLGEIPFTQTYPELWLADSHDVARALDEIRAYEAKPGRDDPPHKCPTCGEDNPASFEVCWRCGRPLAG
jgi:hypothetical protein